MPWYPLYHEAFAMDTQAWTTEEVGCLIRLMNYQWANGFVPNDHDKLCRICGVTRTRWKPIWATLRPKFEQVTRTKLANRRLAAEQKRTAKRSTAGRKAAETRWGKQRKINESDATAQQTQSELDADGMVSTSTSTSTVKNKREASPPLPDGLNREAWDDWLAYRRESKLKKWVPRTVKARTKMLARFTHAEQRTIIDYSIDNGYQGLFPDGALGGSNGRRTLSSPTEEIERATGVKRL